MSRHQPMAASEVVEHPQRAAHVPWLERSELDLGDGIVCRAESDLSGVRRWESADGAWAIVYDRHSRVLSVLASNVRDVVRCMRQLHDRTPSASDIEARQEAAWDGDQERLAALDLETRAVLRALPDMRAAVQRKVGQR